MKAIILSCSSGVVIFTVPKPIDFAKSDNIFTTLWSELFLENKDPLISELDILIDNITKIKDAISAEDADALKALLEKGREVKQALGE